MLMRIGLFLNSTVTVGAPAVPRVVTFTTSHAGSKTDARSIFA